MEKIRYYYIKLNERLNLATPNITTAAIRIEELIDMMGNIEKCKDWKIEVSYDL